MRTPRISLVTFCLTLAIVLVLLPTLAQACPNCKDALAQNDPDHMNLVRGYFWSIMFMLSLPYVIFMGLATYFYLLVRSARLAKAATGTVA